jgi:hypothetical protein
MPKKKSSSSRSELGRAKTSHQSTTKSASAKRKAAADSDSPYRDEDEDGRAAPTAPSHQASGEAEPASVVVPRASKKSSHDGKAAGRSRRGQAPLVDAASVLNAFRPAEFSGVHLGEPFLIFGDGQRESDPKTGLALHKPYDLRTPGRRNQLRLGIIGTGAMIDAAHAWIERCRNRVMPVGMRREKGGVVAKPMDATAYPPFPGLADVFDADFMVGDNMVATLTEAEIASVLQAEFFEQKVTRLIDLIIGRLAVLAEGMQAPDVVIVALPTEVRKECTVPSHHKTRGKQPRTLATVLKAALDKEHEVGQDSLFDVAAAHNIDVAAMAAAEEEAETEQAVFRHGLKARAMAHGIPLQLAWQVTLQGGPTVEDDATRAWNFWTGVYYKAGGIPWRVTGLERGTCYVGIAFYRDRHDGTLRTSMAQAFSDQGEGVVLRSEPFKWSPTRRSKSPHLPKDLSSDLMTRVIAAYEAWHHQPPGRIVVHKWQRYYDDERAGFVEAITKAGIHSYDLIAFGNRGIRFFRAGAEPALRGTMITLAPDDALLYTRGYVPYLGEYPGMRVPRPIEIVEHYGSSAMKKICEEILALTKMDWNSAVYAGKDPITTAFSEDVGQILAEMPPGVHPRPTYRFYM